MPGVKATWEPYEEHGRLTTRNDLPDSVFAFPRQPKEPLTDAQHVRDAIARVVKSISSSKSSSRAHVRESRRLTYPPPANFDVRRPFARKRSGHAPCDRWRAKGNASRRKLRGSEQTKE
jgi:hypothetical protein